MRIAYYRNTLFSSFLWNLLNNKLVSIFNFYQIKQKLKVQVSQNKINSLKENQLSDFLKTEISELKVKKQNKKVSKKKKKKNLQQTETLKIID